MLLQVIRGADIAVRYGGEEILIILPNTTALEAGVLAERFRQAVEFHGLVLSDEAEKTRTIHFTISLGVADLCHESFGNHELIHHADEALYRAKQDGRNRVVIHGGMSVVNDEVGQK
jgi:diguanylate cyclase (GGDEF)-like protein